MTTPESRRNFASQLKREGVGQEEGEEDGEGGRQTKTRIFYLQPFHSLQEEFREKKSSQTTFGHRKHGLRLTSRTKEVI